MVRSKPPRHDVAHISRELRPLARSVSRLHPDPENARVHSAGNLEVIRASLVEHGQQKPIVLQPDGRTVIAGSGTLEVARRLGWKWIAAIKYDGDPAKVAAFGVTDNRSAELATWDDAALLSIFQHYDAIEGSRVLMPGWSTADIEALRPPDESPAGSIDPAAGVDKAAEGFTDEHLAGLKELAGYGTAIRRAKASAPMRWYREHQLLEGAVLDYGCGLDRHGHSGFDPAYDPDYSLLVRRWDVVTCNFVLNVIPIEHNRAEVVLIIRSLLAAGGFALVTVWRKTDGDKKTAKGYQCGWNRDEWEGFLRPLWPRVDRLDAAAFWGWRCAC